MRTEHDKIVRILSNASAIDVQLRHMQSHKIELLANLSKLQPRLKNLGVDQVAIRDILTSEELIKVNALLKALTDLESVNIEAVVENALGGFGES